ncbi:MAG: YbjN domain-containing protein [Verrucomicrobiota bacterium]
MSELFEVVKQAFGEMEWAYEEVPGVEVVKLGFEAYHTKVELHAQVFAEQGVVSVVSQLPLLKRDERVMRVVAELLVRVNRDLTLGGFEMDWPHGQVLFRISNVFVAGAYQSDVIASMVHATVSETDRVTPFVDVVQRMNPGELLVLDVGTLLERKDLLPVVEGDEEDDD